MNKSNLIEYNIVIYFPFQNIHIHIYCQVSIVFGVVTYVYGTKSPRHGAEQGMLLIVAFEKTGRTRAKDQFRYKSPTSIVYSEKTLT